MRVFIPPLFRGGGMAMIVGTLIALMLLTLLLIEWLWRGRHGELPTKPLR